MSECVGSSTSISRRVPLKSVEVLLKELAGLTVGHSRVERVWREALALRDLAFLVDSREARSESRLYLLHDLFPGTWGTIGSWGT